MANRPRPWTPPPSGWAPPPPGAKPPGKHRTAIVGSILGGILAIGVIGAIADANKPVTQASAPVVTATVAPTTVAPSPHPTAKSSPRPVHKAAAKPSPKTCDPGPDIIVWYQTPGVDASAQRLGSRGGADCSSTFDQIRSTSPTGDGYCTEAAWASDNPGYNADADPAAPLDKVQVSVGPGCSSSDSSSTGGSSTTGGGSTTGGAAPVILSPSGHYYRAGEFCPHADDGLSTVDANGNTITCSDVNGYYRWHY